MSQFEQPVFVQSPGGQGYEEPPSTSGLAIASLVCSLIICCPLTTVLGPLLGVIALATHGSNPARKGKGLAMAGIVLGLVFSVGWGIGGYKLSQFWEKMRDLMMQGPNNALVMGTSGDIAGYKDSFHGGGAQATDEEAQAFIDELNARYGALLEAQVDESGNNFTPPSPGQTSMVLPYSLRFDSGVVKADVELVFVDAAGQFVGKIGSIKIIDPDLGNLEYPAADYTPDSPAGDDAADAPAEDGAGEESGAGTP